MKIAILGAGFTGLSSALKLVQLGHEVTVFEKNSCVGGLASGFKEKEWDWSLDKVYHHIFTNDLSAINLAKEVNQKLITKRPDTAVLVNNQMSSFDSPLSLLKFSHLSLINRLRVGSCLFYLRYLSNLSGISYLDNNFALPWLNKFMGKSATEMIWDPLFEGKFGSLKNSVSLTWFWARIKKRTPSLIYPEGGFQQFAEKIQQNAEKLGVKFIFNTEIKDLKSLKFDKIIVTLPTPVFTKIAKLPESYKKKLNSIPHLSALNLILTFKKPFFENGIYWLNITDKSFPFLVLAEHTNFMDPKHYGNQHILYIGSYLPENHPYLKMSPAQLLKIFDPFLKRINSSYLPLATSPKLFILPNSQPIMTPNYKTLKPDFKTPLKNVYLANLDMIYPWDRGVNYAIELGEKIAKIVDNTMPEKKEENRRIDITPKHDLTLMVASLGVNAPDMKNFIDRILKVTDRQSIDTKILISMHKGLDPDNSLAIEEAVKFQYPKQVDVVMVDGDYTFAYAYLKGLQKACTLGKKIIEIDSGGGHLPEELPPFVDGLDSNDFVLSSRFISGGKHTYPLQRRLVSHSATFLSNHFLGTNLTDASSGFEGFNWYVLDKLFQARPPEEWFSATKGPFHMYQTEMRACLSWMKDLSHTEVPVTYGVEKTGKSLPARYLLEALHCFDHIRRSQETIKLSLK